MSKFCSESFFSSSLELSFDKEDSEINFERAHSATVNLLLAGSFESNLQCFKRRRGRPLCGRAACILGMDG